MDIGFTIEELEEITTKAYKTVAEVEDPERKRLLREFARTANELTKHHLKTVGPVEINGRGE